MPAYLGRLRDAGATDMLVDPEQVSDASIRDAITADDFDLKAETCPPLLALWVVRCDRVRSHPRKRRSV